MNENNITSFYFEAGEIINNNFRGWNPHEKVPIFLLESILRPEIEKNKLSGKVELIIFENRARINYINIQPRESVAVLMEVVRAVDMPEIN